MFQKYIPVPGGVENIPGDRPYGEADVLELLEVLVVSDDAGGTKNCRRISFLMASFVWQENEISPIDNYTHGIIKVL